MAWCCFDVFNDNDNDLNEETAKQERERRRGGVKADWWERTKVYGPMLCSGNSQVFGVTQYKVKAIYCRLDRSSARHQGPFHITVIR